MKQKRLLLKTAILCLTGFFIFFNFGSVKKARAACNFEIKRFDTGGQNSVSRTDTLTFTGVIKRSESFVQANDNDQCKNSYFTIIITTNNLTQPNIGNFIIVTRNARPDNFAADGTYTFTKAINLQNYPTSQFVNTPTLNFTLDVHGSLKGTTARTTWQVANTYSGGTSTPPPAGVQPLTITLDTAGAQELGKGDSFTINISIDPSKVRSFPDRITQVTLETYINNSKVGSYSVTRNFLETNSPTQDISSIQAPPFRDGPNDIVVKLIDLASGQPVAQGTGTIRIKGLGTAPISTTQKDNGAVCADSTECKTNFCANDTGKCESCTENSNCSEDGSEVCTAGSCVPAGTKIPDKGNDGTKTGPPVDCSDPKNADNPNCLYNPLPTGNLLDMFLFLAKAFLSMIGVWAVIFIIVGGFRMVLAQGNEEAYTQAKKTITWAIIGVMVAVLSFSIVSIVQNLLKADIKNTIQTQNQ